MEFIEQVMLPEGDYGVEFMRWEVYEYPKYERGRLWYLLMAMVGGGLLIYSLISGNFLFALILVMFALVLYMSAANEPAKVHFVVAEDGVGLGNAFYPYKEMRSFWFVYDPPEVSNLYIDFRSGIHPRLIVDLEAQNPNEVREVLSQFIREDFSREDEPLSDILGRVLKI